MLRVPMFFVASLFLSLAAGCGRSETYVGTDGTRATVTHQKGGEQVTVKGPQGEVVHVAGGDAAVPLPEGFPKDVPINSAAKITTTAKTGEGYSVVMTTKDSLRKVADYYDAQLKAAGWKIENTVNSSDSAMLHAVKDERTCLVMIGGSDGETMVNLNVSDKK